MKERKENGFRIVRICNTDFVVGWRIFNKVWDVLNKEYLTLGWTDLSGPRLRIEKDGIMIQTDDWPLDTSNELCKAGLHFWRTRDIARRLNSGKKKMMLVISRYDETNISYFYYCDKARAQRIMYIPSLKIAERFIKRTGLMLGHARIKNYPTRSS